ncbi:TonB-dependent receptor [Pontiellaceae bacterium B1224]|nr:TonB-dependent receptor [Pontiellaceae bacterium B1224]
MVSRKLFRTLVVGLLFSATAVFAQVGGIRGVVIDSDFEVPLPGVKVVISETGQETVSNDSGSYNLQNVEPGAYTLMFSKGGYTRFTQSGVVVVSGQLKDVEAKMAGEYEEMDELVVRDIQMGGASEVGLLNLRLENVAMMDSVGSDLMGQAGASDAAQALSLVPGTTVQDGKYAVVRGLPDRYVSSQMNSVVLPSADPDKRAVQLDQFPSDLIESMQVTKTFTPNQQGDASGGAVNIVLKSMPKEPVLKFKLGTKYKTTLPGDADFLTYTGVNMDYWGQLEEADNPQPSGTTWNGAVGTTKGDAPPMYNWSLTAGDTFKVADNVNVSALGNFYYKSDASYIGGATDDKWWFRDGEYVPIHSEEDPLSTLPYSPAGKQFKTSLYDVDQSTEEIQWGGLGSMGVEVGRQQVSLLYMETHVAEKISTLAEDTAGKDFYVTSQVPGYDPLAPGDSGDYEDAAPYRRSQTLQYVERDTSTLQLHGEHVLPFPEFGKEDFLWFLEPELDWTIASSDSYLNSPDKRLFGSLWKPGFTEITPGGRNGPQTNTVAQSYYQDKPPVQTLGNVQRIWETIDETSDQFFLNGSLPFEQWSGDKGALKLGLFNDEVRRTYTKDSYSNTKEVGSPEINPTTGPSLPWSEFWTDYYPTANDVMFASTIDAGYEGTQDISAWYYMLELPISSQFTFIGGARYESTDISTTIVDQEADVYWVKPGGTGLSKLLPGEADVDYQEDDVLPSLGLEIKPLDSVTIRLAYAETVARQTFKELTPLQQQEYLGAEVFVGNPNLTMSNLKNYDLRVDYSPYPGGLISGSWFYKTIEDPIEYTQGYADNVGSYITPVNYPEGELTGVELEFRQQLGHFWQSLEGLTFGANATFIQSEVTLDDADAARLEAAGYPGATRDMLNTPDRLFNVNLTYDIAKFGTQLGLFYFVKGDTLVAGANSAIGYTPDVYATEFGVLNFSVSQKLGNHMRLTFKAKNLTDPEIQEVYRSPYTGEDQVKTSYQRGLEYSLDLTTFW